MANFIPIEFQKSFDKTEQNAIAITATFTASPPPLGSQFGGYPYWQDNVDLPLDEDGTPMALLAQINFADIPKHPDLPDHGILQFFIPKHDDYYGADLDRVSRGQLITQFWENPHPDQAINWPQNLSQDDLIPTNGAHRLQFDHQKDYAGIDTLECANALGANPFEILEDTALNEKEEMQFFDAITDFTANYGHKLLGYPYFAQTDPRDNNDYRLFLQIDTDMDGDNDIMWGDNGVGHVFIRNVDLLAKQFDKVWFYWDCC